jgi:hypothetical protein
MGESFGVISIVIELITFFATLLISWEKVKERKFLAILLSIGICIVLYMVIYIATIIYNNQINNNANIHELKNEIAAKNVSVDTPPPIVNDEIFWNEPIPAQASESVQKILVNDNFSDNGNNWITQEEELISSYIYDGKYIHKISCPKDYVDEYCLYFIPVPDLNLRDFEIGFDATITKLSQNPRVIIAIFARKNENGYYYLGFRNIGTYSFITHYLDADHSIVSSEVLGLYNRSNNSTNRYGMIVQDEFFIPKINGEVVCTENIGNGQCYIRNKDNNDEGEIDIVLFISRGDSAIISIDNLIVNQR